MSSPPPDIISFFSSYNASVVRTQTTSSTTSSSTAAARNASNLCPQWTSVYWTISAMLPAHGFGASYASQCQYQSSSWSEASATWSMSVHQSFAPHSAATVVTDTSTSIFSDGTASTPYTTFCDGFPRAHGSWTILPNKTATSTTIATSTPDVMSLLQSDCQARYGSITSPTYPAPTPSCSINPSDCAVLWSTFLSNNPSWSSGNGDSYTPGCATSDPITSAAPIDPMSTACQVTGDNVRLHYWPASTTRSDPCDDKTITVGPRFANVTKTAIINGVTVTSPDVLLEIDGLTAEWHDPFNHGLSTSFSNIQVTIPSSELSSIVETLSRVPFTELYQRKFQFAGRYQPSLVAEPYNIQNIEGPVVARDYFLAPNPIFNSAVYHNGNDTYANLPSSWGRYSTIFDDYSPFISIPKQIRTLDSRLQTCSLAINGLYDPPQSITSASFVAVTPTHSQIGGPPGPSSAAPGPSQAPAPAPTTAPPPLNPPSTSPAIVQQPQQAPASTTHDPIASTAPEHSSSSEPISVHDPTTEAGPIGSGFSQGSTGNGDPAGELSPAPMQSATNAPINPNPQPVAISSTAGMDTNAPSLPSDDSGPLVTKQPASSLNAPVSVGDVQSGTAATAPPAQAASASFGFAPSVLGNEVPVTTPDATSQIGAALSSWASNVLITAEPAAATNPQSSAAANDEASQSTQMAIGAATWNTGALADQPRQSPPPTPGSVLVVSPAATVPSQPSMQQVQVVAHGATIDVSVPAGVSFLVQDTTAAAGASLSQGQTSQTTEKPLILSAGGAPLVAGTHTFSVASDDLVIDAASSQLDSAPSSNMPDMMIHPSQGPSITSALAALPTGSAASIAGHSVAALSGGSFDIDGMTTVSTADVTGAMYSAAYDSYLLTGEAATIAHMTPGQMTSANGLTVSAVSGGSFVVDGATVGATDAASLVLEPSSLHTASHTAQITAISPGAATTWEGHTVSRASGGYVVDSSTYSDAAAAASAVSSLGADGVLWTALNTMAAVPFTTDGHTFSRILAQHTGGSAGWVVDGTATVSSAWDAVSLADGKSAALETPTSTSASATTTEPPATSANLNVASLTPSSSEPSQTGSGADSVRVGREVTLGGSAIAVLAALLAFL